MNNTIQKKRAPKNIFERSAKEVGIERAKVSWSCYQEKSEHFLSVRYCMVAIYVGQLKNEFRLVNKWG